MPIDSAESARAWMLANSQEGVGHKSQSDSVVDAVRKISLRPPALSDVSAPDDPAGTLARMREIEQRAYALIDGALTRAKRTQAALDYAALPGLLRSYNQAAANSLAAASAWEKHCRAAGEVSPVEHLVNVLQTTLEPLMAQLSNLPALVAPKANPADPIIAETAIRTELDAIRNQIATALAAPVPPAPAS